MAVSLLWPSWAESSSPSRSASFLGPVPGVVGSRFAWPGSTLFSKKASPRASIPREPRDAPMVLPPPPPPPPRVSDDDHHRRGQEKENQSNSETDSIERALSGLLRASLHRRPPTNVPAGATCRYCGRRGSALGFGPLVSCACACASSSSMRRQKPMASARRQQSGHAQKQSPGRKVSAYAHAACLEAAVFETEGDVAALLGPPCVVRGCSGAGTTQKHNNSACWSSPGAIAVARAMWRRYRTFSAPLFRLQMLAVVGQTLMANNAPREAEPVLREAVAVAKKISGEYHWTTLWHATRLAKTLRAAGRVEPARRVLEHIYRCYSHATRTDEYPTFLFGSLATAFLDADLHLEAQVVARAALAASHTATTRFDDDHQDTKNARAAVSAAENQTRRPSHAFLSTDDALFAHYAPRDATPLLRACVDEARVKLGARHAITTHVARLLAQSTWRDVASSGDSFVDE